MSVSRAQATGSRDSRRAMWSSFLGSAVEFYDFLLYVTAATLVFPSLFFGNLDPGTATILSYVTLAAGYLSRPLGGVLFGHFGDRLGRKKMLLLTLVLMGTVSALIGLLPTYAQIGVLAPVLLVLLRIVQGLAMGGEWAGAALMAMEHSGEKRKGLGASVAVAGGPAGAILSTSVLAVFSLLPEDQFMSWGWRVPFLLSVSLVAIGLYLRLRVAESPEFEQTREAGRLAQGLPLLDVFRNHPRVLALTFIGGIAPIFVQNMINSFGINYAIQTGGHERSTTLWIFTAVTAIHMLVIFGSAAASDRFGRRNVMVAGMLLGVLCVWPGFALVAQGDTLSLFLGFVLLAPVGQGVMYGPIGAYMAEMYATGSRYTGAGLSYQLSSAIGGGFAPVVSASLVMASGGSVVSLNIVAGLICAASAVAVAFSLRASRADEARRAARENPTTQSASTREHA